MENAPNHALEEAVKKNDASKVRELLELGDNPNFRPQYYYRSLLHLAVDNNYIDVIELLVQHGVTLDLEEIKFIFNLPNRQFTKEIVNRIVKHERSSDILKMMFDELINGRDYEGTSSAEILGLLLDNGIPVEDTNFDHEFFTFKRCVFQLLISQRKTSLVEQMLKRGADPNKIFLSNDRTPLTTAASNNDESMAELLLNYGASLNERNKLGYTALQSAIRDLHTDLKMVKFLLERGADVNEKSSCGQSCLHLAIKVRDSKMIKILLERGAVIDEKDKNEKTALHLAAENYNSEAATILLENGCDINCKDKYGLTPLMTATNARDPAMVDLLLKKGASVNERSKDGKTALHFSAKNIAGVHFFSPPRAAYTIATNLLRYGADLNILDSCNETPLSSRFVNYEAVEVLVEELAVMTFKQQPICDVNLGSLRRMNNSMSTSEIFADCLSELQRMNECKFWKDLTVADIFKTERDWKGLISLTTNEDFTWKFENEMASFRHYNTYLKHIFLEAVRRESILKCEMTKIRESGLQKKYRLPEEIVQMIVWLAYEDIFTDKLVPMPDKLVSTPRIV